MKNRKSPKKLVHDFSTRATIPNWFTKLKADQREYVLEVVSEMQKQPGVMLHPIAAAIKAELLLSTKRDTIARKLKELLNEKA